MPNINDLRKQYAGSAYDAMTDLEIVDFLARKQGRAADAVAYDLGVQMPNDPGFTTSLKNSLYGTAQGVGQLANDFIPGLEGNSLERYGRAGVQRNPVDIMDGQGGAFENIVSNFADRPLDVMGQIGGQAVGLMVPGAAVRGANLGLRAFRGAQGVSAAERAALGTFDTAAFGAAPYGQMRDAQEAKGMNSLEDKLTALGSAAAIGTVERAFGLESALAGRGIGGNSWRGAIGRQMLGEAGEEAVQAPIERFGSGEEVLSYDTLDQMAAGAFAGGIGGGMYGAAFGWRAPAEAALRDQPQSSGVPLQPDATGSVDLTQAVEFVETNPFKAQEIAGMQPSEVSPGLIFDPTTQTYREVPQNRRRWTAPDQVTPDGSLQVVENVLPGQSQDLFGASPRYVADAVADPYALEPGPAFAENQYGQMELDLTNIDTRTGDLFATPNYNLVTNPQAPLVDRINQNFGLPVQPMTSRQAAAQRVAQRKQNMAAVTEAVTEPTNVRVSDADTFIERPLDTGELFAMQAGGQNGQVQQMREDEVQLPQGQEGLLNNVPAAAPALVLRSPDGARQSTPQDFGFKSEKKLAAFKRVIEAYEAGELDYDTAFNFGNSIATTNKIGRIEKQIEDDIADYKRQSLGKALTQPAETPQVMQQQTQAMTNILNQVLTPAQKRWFDARQDFANENKSDAQVAADLGISKQAASELGKNPRKKIVADVAKVTGLTEAQAEAAIVEHLKRTRTTIPADAESLGLSPELQQSVIDNDELFGSEDSGANMTMLDSAGESKLGMGEKLEPSTINDADPVYEARVAEAKAARERDEDILLASGIAGEAAEAWDDYKVESAPSAAELPKSIAAAWVIAYGEYKYGQITEAELDAEQRGLEYEAQRGLKFEEESYKAEDTGARGRVQGATGSSTEAQRGLPGSTDTTAAEPAQAFKPRNLKEVMEEQGTTSLRPAPLAEVVMPIDEMLAKLREMAKTNSVAADYLREAQYGRGDRGEITRWIQAVEGDTNAYRRLEGGSTIDYGNRPNLIPVLDQETEKRAKAVIDKAFAEFDEAVGARFSELVNYVGVVKFAGQGQLGLAVQYGTAVDIYVSDEEIGKRSALHTLRHEIAHALDYLTGHFFSGDPAMKVAYDKKKGGYVGVGAVAREIIGVYQSGRVGANVIDSILASELKYPLSPELYGDLTEDTATVQQEMFAQVMALFANPNTRPLVEDALPVTTKFIKERIVYETLTQKISAFRKATAPAPEPAVSGPKRAGNNRNPYEYGGTSPRSNAYVRRAESGTGSQGRDNGVLPSPTSSQEITSTMSDTVRSAVLNVGDKLSKLNPKLLTTFQLVDQFGKDLPSLTKYAGIADRMARAQQQFLKRAEPTMLAWSEFSRKSPAMAKLLDGVMLDATLQEMHADKPFTHESNNHLSPSARNAFDALQTRYDALPAEAKKIYQDVKAMLADNWQLRKEIYAGIVRTTYEKELNSPDQKVREKAQKRMDDEIKRHAAQIKELKGPYFPAMRFGDKILSIESKELKAKRAQLQTATASEYKALAAEIAAMERQDKHYQVSAYESAADLERDRVELEKRFGTKAKVSRAELFVNELRPATFVQLEKLEDILGGVVDRKEAAKLQSAFRDAFLSSLPEHSALQRQIKRKGVRGASDNMLRSFAETVEKDSFYLARLQHMGDITKALNDMRNESRGDIKLGDVYNNVRERVGMDFQYNRSPILSAITRVSSIWHLGIAPSYILTNMTQPFMITMPQLAGRYGAGKAARAIRSAWVDAKDAVKAGRDGKFFSLDETKLEKGLEPDEAAFIRELEDTGKLDIANNADTEVYTSGASPKMAQFWRVFNWASHNTELVNRLTTALAAYRLDLEASANTDLSYEDRVNNAKKRARDAIELTQLDYSDVNAAYFMKAGHLGGLNRLPMQFRKYQQGMIYLLGKNLKESFGAGPEAAEARKAFVYLMAMQTVFTGIRGVPVVAPLLFLAGLSGDADDEKGDLATQLRNYTAELMGPDVARAFWKGLPAMMGMDVANLSMENLLSPLPMMRANDVLDSDVSGEDAVGRILLNSMGAPAGLAARFFDAANFMREGDFQRGLEKALPKFLASPIKAARLSETGVTTRSGNTAIEADEVSAWDTTLKAAGFSPIKESEYYEALSAKENVSDAIRDRRNKVIAEYGQARLNKEPIGSAMDAVKQFNMDHPTQAITYDTLLKSLTQRGKDKTERDSAGIRFRKNEQGLRDITRFAQQE